MSVQTAAATGLRERKKERTRQALIDAAYELFERNGFDATTVEEIAAAVEVSPRTFFRYFASKEDVALTLQDDLKSAVIAELAARPAAEPVMTAIRQAFHGAMQAFREDDGSSPLEDDDGGMAQRFACYNDLIATSPSLFAASLEHTTAKQDDIIALIADRMGADPATDLRPHLAAAAAVCAARAAVETWKRAGGPNSVPEGMEQVFGLLEESINYPAAPRTR